MNFIKKYLKNRKAKKETKNKLDLAIKDADEVIKNSLKALDKLLEENMQKLHKSYINPVEAKFKYNKNPCDEIVLKSGILPRATKIIYDRHGKKCGEKIISGTSVGVLHHKLSDGTIKALYEGGHAKIHHA